MRRFRRLIARRGSGLAAPIPQFVTAPFGGCHALCAKSWQKRQVNKGFGPKQIVCILAVLRRYYVGIFSPNRMVNDAYGGFC